MISPKPYSTTYIKGTDAVLLRVLRAMCAVTVLLCLGIAATAERRALVIGIGRYADESWQKIHGDRDVSPMAEMLRANGFADLRTLSNEFATFAAIRHELTSLSLRAEPGDTVYVHFSGHGQRVSDLDGDEQTDSYDEAWVPCDAPRHPSATYKGERHITDDLLGRWLEAIARAVGPEGMLALSVDACHSGDSTRDPSGAPEAEAVRGTADIFVIPPQGDAASKRPRPEMKWVMLSACRDYQLNTEYSGMGRLCYLLTRHWRDYRSLDNTALQRALDRQMNSRPMRAALPQNPQLEGSLQFSKIFRP